MWKVYSSNIIESFELGDPVNVKDYFFNTHTGCFLVLDDYSVLKVSDEWFRHKYNISFDVLMSTLKTTGFVGVDNFTGVDIDLFDCDCFGFYYENDFQFLLDEGLWGESWIVKSELNYSVDIYGLYG